MSKRPLGRWANPRPQRYEARAVWKGWGASHTSQPVADFDRQPLHARKPDEFAVYVVGGGYVEFHPERAAAEQHAGELNGDAA